VIPLVLNFRPTIQEGLLYYRLNRLLCLIRLKKVPIVFHMASIRRTILFLAVLVVLTRCNSVKVKDEPTLTTASELANKGNKNAWEEMEKALAAPPPEKEPDLHSKIFERLSVMDPQKALPILEPYLTDRIEKKRAGALSAWSRQLSRQPSQANSAKLLAAIASNQKTYSILLPEEIQALSEMDGPEALAILKEELNANRGNRELVVQALGKILSREVAGRRMPVDSKPEVPAEEDTPSVPEAPLETGEGLTEEDIMGYIPAATEKGDGENFYSSLPESEKILIDAIAAEDDSGLDLLVLRNIQAAWGTEWEDHFASLYQEKSFVSSLRGRILLFWAQRTERDKLAEAAKLRKQYKPAGEDLKPYILQAISILEGKTPEEILAELTSPPKPKVAKRSVVLPAKPVAELRRVPWFGRRHSVADSVWPNVDVHTATLLRQYGENPSPESRLVYSALSKIHPSKDYYQLLQIERPLYERRFLFYLLSMIEGSRRSAEWKVYAIQKTLGLSAAESRHLLDGFKREGRLLF